MKTVLLVVAILNLIAAGLLFFTREWMLAWYQIGSAIFTGTAYAILDRLDTNTEAINRQAVVIGDALRPRSPSGARSFEDYKAERDRA